MPAFKVHKTGTTDAAWDGPKMKTNVRSGEKRDYYGKVFAWYDPKGDEGVKSTYKFVHHMVSADGTPGAANIKGCQSGIGVLNGGMGGADIPDADRKAVYAHLAAHLKDADIEAPDLRALTSGEKRQMEMEMDIDDITTSDVYYACMSGVTNLTHVLHALEHCANAADSEHQAAQAALRGAILACAVCWTDCGGYPSSAAAQMVESSRAAVAACVAADEALDAMTCEDCADDCAVGDAVLGRVMMFAALNAGDEPPMDEDDATDEMRGQRGQPQGTAPTGMEKRQVNLRVDVKGHEVRAWSARVGVEGNKIIGYAAVFDQPSRDLGGFTEVVRRGAFKRAIGEEQDVRALWQHDPNFVLGRTKNGTLSMSEDVHGLRVEIDPPDTQWARDAMTSIRRGDVDQMSFTFEAKSDSWTSDGGGIRRELLDADLFDVSPVTFPAYPQTSVSARSVALTPNPSPNPPPKGEGLQGSNGLAGSAHLRRRLEIAEKI